MYMGCAGLPRLANAFSQRETPMGSAKRGPEHNWGTPS